MSLSDYRFRMMVDDGTSALWRGFASGKRPILIRRASEGVPDAELWSRFDNERSLSAHLDDAWAVVPVSIDAHEGARALVMSDSGGEPLSKFLGRPMDVTSFLGKAVALVSAIDGMHRSGLIHKDIKPSNVLVDDGFAARLTGFGSASRNLVKSEGHQVLHGTPAYMSPEQTGRISVPVDHRSDLYALGMTFYEMLTGSPAFPSSDPLELIHSQIARLPVAPCVRVESVPTQLSAIVMKLVNKDPEERYQSASALLMDLNLCAQIWKHEGYIKAFPVALGDRMRPSIGLRKLYGRELESARLAQAAVRLRDGIGGEFIVVSGPSGIGKSMLLDRFKEANGQDFAFASGKADQLKRGTPYDVICQAFQPMLVDILSETDDIVEGWRSAVRDSLGASAGLVIPLIPQLATLLELGVEAIAPPQEDRKSLFFQAFCQFASVMARAERPLVLVLDDLQWADHETLELLEQLAIDPRLSFLMIVCTFRGNGIHESVFLQNMLDRVRSTWRVSHEIVLGALTIGQVRHMVSDTRLLPTADRSDLATVVHSATEGNPFFASQLIAEMAAERLFALNTARDGSAERAGATGSLGMAESVAELVKARLSRLPEECRRLLGEMAIVGGHASLNELSAITDRSEGRIVELLELALAAELVVRRGRHYAFFHDRIYEAAYELTPPSDRAGMHLSVGRRLLDKGGQPDWGDGIFDAAGQMNRGVSALTDTGERREVAKLNLVAAKRAASATAYDAACGYLRAGRAADPGGEEELTFELEYMSAECEFLTGQIEDAEARLSLLAARSMPLKNAGTVARLRIAVYTTKNEFGLAVRTGLSYLHSVGIEWTDDPTSAVVDEEYAKVWEGSEDRQIEDLVDLGAMSDPTVQATIDVLTAMQPPAMYLNANLNALVICRIINLSFEFGNSDGSCFAYVYATMIVGARFGNYPDAFRFGRLGLALVEKHGLIRYEARVRMCFGNMVLPWARHMKLGEPMVREAFSQAIAKGDLNTAAYSCNHLITNLLANGTHLQEVLDEAQQRLRFVSKTKFYLIQILLTTQMRLIGSLQGRTQSVASFEDDSFNEAEFQARLVDDAGLKIAACWYWIRKLQACFWGGELHLALEAVEMAGDLAWTSPGFLEMAEFHFFAALAHAEGARDEVVGGVDFHRRKFEEHRDQIAIWQNHCDANFGSRLALLDAELAHLERRFVDAEELFELAIRKGREQGFVQLEAMAFEAAGRFYLSRGLQLIADTYFDKARECYERWGAFGKSRQIEVRYGRDRDELVSRKSQDVISSAPHLDLLTVSRMSQAVSSEIVLDRLLEAAITTCLRYAGATKGALWLPTDEQSLVEATTDRNSEEICVKVRRGVDSASGIPERIQRLVMRTRDVVYVNDVDRSIGHLVDRNILATEARSVLCMPLVNQAKLVGILYLENHLVYSAFTSEHIEVLKLIASQAAISVVNARLYSSLQASERRYEKTLSSIGDGVVAMDDGGRVTFINQAAEMLTGCSHREAIGVDRSGVLVFADEETGDVLSDPVAELVDSHTQVGWLERIVMVAKDGSRRPIRLSGSRIQNDEGHVTGHVVVLSDMTLLRKANEGLREAQSNLARISRVTTMGEFAASIAHEVNQPLMAIVTNADALIRWLDRGEQGHEQAKRSAERIVRDGHRAGDIIRSIRAISNNAQVDFVAVDLNEIILGTVALVRTELRRQNISLSVNLERGSVLVMGDRVQLQQVVLNLIMNGSEAMLSEAPAERLLALGSSVGPDGNVRVTVDDNGHGVSELDAEKIFNAFYTTKMGGVGMGLSICKSIIDAHGGRIWTEPRTPCGARFSFTLPIAAQASIL